MIRTFIIFVLALILTQISSYAMADWLEEGDYFYFQTSLYTTHFDPKDEHNNHQHLINLELQKKSNWLVGLAFFDNSFGQPSEFGYIGYNWTIPSTNELLYAKLVGGLMHGYEGEHKDKIPLNEAGIAPAILPSFGIKYKRVHSEIALFGFAGAMLTIGVNFPIAGEAP